jgi:hypothetical protein
MDEYLDSNNSNSEICYDGEVAKTFAADVAPIIREMFSERRTSSRRDDVETVWMFNDDYRTRKEDVLAVVDEVRRRKGQNVSVEIPAQVVHLDNVLETV